MPQKAQCDLGPASQKNVRARDDKTIARKISRSIASPSFLQAQQLTLDRVQRIRIASPRGRYGFVDPFPRGMIIRDQATVHMGDRQGVHVDHAIWRTPDGFIAHVAQALVQAGEDHCP